MTNPAELTRAQLNTIVHTGLDDSAIDAVLAHDAILRAERDKYKLLCRTVESMRTFLLALSMFGLVGCEQKIEQVVPVMPTEPCSIEAMIDKHKHDFVYFYTLTTGRSLEVYGMNAIEEPDPHLLCRKERA